MLDCWPWPEGLESAVPARQMTLYPGIACPLGIAAAPGGAMSFTNFRNNSIGRITTSGTITTYTGAGISSPRGIMAGPNGALSFTDYGSIGRLGTNCKVTSFP